MAHFAQIQNGIVTRVIVVANQELLVDGIESEAKGVEFCQSLFGGIWVQTSYNSTIRKNFAGIGFAYDDQLDAFIPIKPYPSWILNKDTCKWFAPISMPIDGNFYNWDESTKNWIEVTL